MAGGRRLTVEVVAAKGLMPKDGQGSANAYCVMDLDGQRKRTKVKSRDLDPAWNEQFDFIVSEVGMQGDLEIIVQNERKSGTPPSSSSFLGRVLVSLSTVPNKPEAVRWCPLQKRGLFSHIKGELGLRIWWQSDQNSQSKGYKMIGEAMIPNMVSVVGEKRKRKKEAKAEKVPEGSGPNLMSAAEVDFTVKAFDPDLGKAVDYNQDYDLVEAMAYFFIRVVRARNLIGKKNGLSDPYVRLSVGRVKVETKTIRNSLDPEWNQVFAIGRDKMQGGGCEVSVWDADKLSKDCFLGGIMLDLSGIPVRKPSNSPLAPLWYALESKTDGKGIVRGDVMVTAWWGTQADEAFPEAWHSDAGSEAQFRSKVFLTPKLWYLRVNVIEAQELLASETVMNEPCVRIHVDTYQTLRTMRAATGGMNPFWNEDLMFVAAEPFDGMMHLVVEDKIAPGKDEILGHVSIPLMNIERRIDGSPIASRWYDLNREGGAFSGRLHLRFCLEGGYHVIDESSMYISDTRPSARQLWRRPLGVLELGIHGVNNLLPTKTTKDNRGSRCAYCVAKYGPKWVRTRTIFKSLHPRWNEPSTWEVYDPCTVLTVGVYDDRHVLPAGPNQVLKDLPLGKVRIRLSTLESGRVYTNAYPLLIVTPQGVKKMGELELTVRFSSTAAVGMMSAYLQPQLPRMHFIYPIDIRHKERLRVAAMNIVALRLMRAVPPLRQEVVQFMLDTEAERWSVRRSKAAYKRTMVVLGDVLAIMNWFTDIRMWKNPVSTVVVHILFLIMVWFPELLLPAVFLHMFLNGAWNYRFRSRTPPFMDAKLSQGNQLDEFEEELGVAPANRAEEIMKIRYERLRGVAGRIQNVIGDLSDFGEKLQLLFSWRDPRATAVFGTFCAAAAIVLYVTPFQVVVVLLGVYIMRHPRFRDPLPSVPLNFFKRLPSRADELL